jgi:hypothetical protein
MEPVGFLDQWIKFTAQDWGFLVGLCSLAVWMRRSKMIHDLVADWFPVILALVYGIAQAVEAGYGVGTFMMFKGVTLAAGTIAAQAIADRVLPVKADAKLPVPPPGTP